MRLALLASVLLALATSGCGAGEEADQSPSKPMSVTEGRLLPPPPIEALDQPVPDDSAIAVDTVQKTYVSPWGSACFTIGPTGESSELKGKECAEEWARIDREEREHREAVAPLRESGRRLVAQLSLGTKTKSVLRLASWRARRNLLCLDYELVEGDEAFSWGGYGPCNPSYPCSDICLEEAVYGQERIAAVGAVDAAAEEIRFTLANGEQIRYPLVGPPILGSDHRAFLGDLGSHDYQRVELIRDQKVVATDGPATRLRLSECLKRFQLEREFAECMGRRD